MSFRHPTTKKDFAREVFFGMSLVVCLFAIFLYVAIQRSTGRSLSPLSYLFPDESKEGEELTPIDVFESEEDRREAMRELQEVYPYKELVNEPQDSGLDDDAEKNRETSSIMRSKSHDQSKIVLAQGIDDQDKQKATVRQTQFAEPARKNAKSNSSVSKADFIDSTVEEKDSGFRPKSSDPTLPLRQSKTVLPTKSFVPNKLSKKNEPPINRQPLPTKGFDDRPKTRFEDVNRPPVKETPFASKPFGQSRVESNPSSDRKRKSAMKNSLKIYPKADDSFFSLSTQYYGDGKYFRELAEFNGCDQTPDELPSPVLIPPLKNLLEAKNPKQAKQVGSKNASSGQANDSVSKGRKLYRTQLNETTFEIAKEELGSASRYLEIIRLNKSRLPENCDAQTRLPEGLQLELPQQ